jgi:hypothetical protein
VIVGHHWLGEGTRRQDRWVADMKGVLFLAYDLNRSYIRAVARFAAGSKLGKIVLVPEA